MFSDPAAGGIQTTPEQEAEMESFLGEIAGGLQETNKEIDDAEDYVGIMNAIRGNNQSIEQRRSELASYIGKEDANATPESALTLVQPTFSMIEASEQGPEEGGPIVEQGIVSVLGDLGSAGAMGGVGSMQAPRQGEAIARMAMGEKPVMRSSGSQGDEIIPYGQSLPGAFNPAPLVSIGPGTKTSQEQILQNLLGNIPEAQTTEQLLPKYLDLYGDSAKAYELNPYIAGLQLAGAVANAPKGELLSRILAPETIKAVSDPIMEMAKAKSQSDLLAKKAAMEAATASKSAETEAKRAITVAAVPKLLERENLITQTVGNTTYVIDPKAFREATNAGQPYTPMSLTGDLQDRFQLTSLGDGQYATVDKMTGQTTVGGDGTTKWIKVESKQGDVILYNQKNPNEYVKVQSGGGEIVGDAKNGFVRLLDGKGTLLDIEGYTYPGDTTPLILEAERYGELKGKANLTAAETGELEALTAKIMPNYNPTEFQTLMNEYVQGFENSISDIGLDPGQIGQRVNAFKQNILKSYIEAKTAKPGAEFDPLAARNKAASTATVDTLKAANEIATTAQGLLSKGQYIVATTEAFQGGQLGSTKLYLGKIAQELGISDAFKAILEKSGLSEGESLEQFLGGDIAVGEVQKALGNAMVVDLAGSFPGNLNQTEIDILMDAAMGIGKSPEANKLLFMALENIADRQKGIAEGLTKFAQQRSAAGDDDFTIMTSLFDEEVRLQNQFDDPEQNPKLDTLLKAYRGSGLAGARNTETQNQTTVPVDVAKSYTTTAAIEEDYQMLKDTYPLIFVSDLPTESTARTQALNDILEAFKARAAE